MKTLDIELALAHRCDYSHNVIVPNVFWGLGFSHELDLCIMSKSGYLTEIEIKVSLQDLKKDREKTHCHIDRQNRIKYLYFAMPSSVACKGWAYIPEDAGLYAVSSAGRVIELIKPKQRKGVRPLTEKEQLQLCRLSTMRVWKLKHELKDKQNLIKHLRDVATKESC